MIRAQQDRPASQRQHVLQSTSSRLDETLGKRSGQSGQVTASMFVATEYNCSQE